MTDIQVRSRLERSIRKLGSVNSASGAASLRELSPRSPRPLALCPVSELPVVFVFSLCPRRLVAGTDLKYLKRLMSECEKYTRPPGSSALVLGEL